MKFSGRLQVEADSRNWLKADLVLDRGRLELTSGDDVLGTWATSQVSAERVEGDRFSLQLGEEAAMFIADDALGFSYEALPQLNKRHLIPVGGMMEKIKSGFRAEETRPLPAAEEPAPASPGPTSAASLTGKRLRELIKEAAAPPSPAGGDPEPKRGLGLEGVFKRRQTVADAPDPEPAPDEELLERLFDEVTPPGEEVEAPASIWADLGATDDFPLEEAPFSLDDPEQIDWSANPLGETRSPAPETLAPSWAGWSPPAEPDGEPESPALPAATTTPADSPLAGLAPDLAGAVERVAQAMAGGSLNESQLNALTDLVRAVAAAARAETPPS